jgi:hypothetical protein
MSEFLAIGREAVFSPGKVDADRAILDAVATILRGRDHWVRVASPEAALPRPPSSTLVFAMSQGEPALATLRHWETDGIRVVNSVASILGCHRHRLLDRIQRAGLPVPDAVWLGLAEPPSPAAWPDWLDADGAWIKRGDVHAIHADDVVFVRGRSAAVDAVTRFRARGITRAVLQRHVEGPVVKFYGVRGRFFSCVSPSGAHGRVVAETRGELRAVAERASRAIGLEIYGGDCVVTVTGSVQLIDVNDWPSFGPCRTEGAEAIAARLEELSLGGDR